MDFFVKEREIQCLTINLTRYLLIIGTTNFFACILNTDKISTSTRIFYIERGKKHEK